MCGELGGKKETELKDGLSYFYKISSAGSITSNFRVVNLNHISSVAQNYRNSVVLQLNYYLIILAIYLCFILNTKSLIYEVEIPVFKRIDL